MQQFKLLTLEDMAYESRARLALQGPEGSGKTFSAILLALGLSERLGCKKTVVIDTENKTAGKFLRFFKDTFNFEYQIIAIGEKDRITGKRNFSPAVYTEAILFAESQGFDICIIDSLSHAWTAEGGALDLVNDAAQRSSSRNSYFAWRDVTPLHNRFVDSMVQSTMHIIGTTRVKTEYVIEQNLKGGQSPRKVGLAPVMRDGLMYEFDIVFELDQQNHAAVVSKSRCIDIDNKIFTPLTKDVGKIIGEWLSGKPDPRRQPLPEEAVAEVRALAKQLGTDVEKIIEDALRSRIVPGTADDTLTEETLQLNVIPRLRTKLDVIRKQQEEKQAKLQVQNATEVGNEYVVTENEKEENSVTEGSPEGTV